MQVILIALVAGYIVGYLLDYLASLVIHFIHEKEDCAEMGAIAYASVRRPSLVGHFSEHGISGLLEKSFHFFFKRRFNSKSLSVKTSPVVVISSVFSGMFVWYFGVTLVGGAALLCFYFLILLGFIDSETGYLPDCVTYPFLWAGLLVNIKAMFVPLHIALISALSAYLVCRLINRVFKLITGSNGMGYGDFKMIAALGAWFGWMCLVFIVIMASLLAIVTGLTRMFSGRSRFETYFPFGPYLAIATLPVLLYGRILMQTLNDFS